MITQERLKELLDYYPETGEFKWKEVKQPNQIKVGYIAGTLSKSTGYRCIKIEGKLYKAHRLAWLYVHGKFPEHFIDHINGNRADNRISNLRQATRAENNRNAKMPKTNTSGVKGLMTVFCKTQKRYYWRTTIGDDASNNFPYTEEGKQRAIQWLEETRNTIHGDFARNS